MGKSKEEDKIEKIIRGLLKLAENRRCINCNTLGPQYVCSNFWIFVCTNCSGVHREFTHRVKSVSMAKFSMEEANALQAGGNEKARQIYLKTWDPHRNHFPENSNIQRIRDFIKRVYVDRQYTGETHPVLVPRNSGLAGSYERRRAHTGDNSTFQEKSFDRYSRYSYEEVRSPQYLRDQVGDPRENSRYGGFRTNASCHESRGGRFQVDDPKESSRYGGSRASSRLEAKLGHYQVDNTRVAGWAATQMFTTEDIRPRKGSPDQTQSSDMDTLTVGHVKEILGENSIALRIANNPKFADKRGIRPAVKAQHEGHHHKESYKGRDHRRTSHRRTVSANTQDTAESSSKRSFNNAELKAKSGSAGSLLAIADSPSVSDEPGQQPGPQEHSASKPPVKEKSCNAHPQNTLELLLLDLSSPSKKTPSAQSGILCDEIPASSSSSSNQLTWHNVSTPSTRERPSFEVVPMLPSGSGDSSRVVAAARPPTDEHTSSAAATSSNTLSTSMPGRSTDADISNVVTYQTMQDLLGDDGAPATEEAGGKQYFRTQHLDQSGTSVSDSISSSIQTSLLIEGTNNYPRTVYSTPIVQVNYENSTASSSHPDQGQTSETESSVDVRPSPADAKAGGRAELPAELFASPYQLSSMSASGWQTGPSYGMGFNINYYPPQMSQMKIPTFPSMAKSRNPFDTDDSIDQSHNNMFAPKEFAQGGLTNMFTPSGMSHTTNFGSHLLGPASNGSPAYPSSFLYQPYLGQQSIPYRIPTSTQGANGYGSEYGSAVSFQSNQQFPYQYPAPTDQNPFPTSRGNPFG